MDENNLKIIFGIKIKSHRTEQKLSLQELSQKTGMALSYLSEIESGKKYPKPEKMLKLSQALGIEYDALVSTRISKELDPLAALINSDLIRQFPFHLFGISARDILGLFKNSPENAHAFLETFLQIGRAYDMSLENFLFAALRTYVRQHNNFFPELEENGDQFIEKHLANSKTPSYERLKTILEQDFSYRVEESDFNDYPSLRGLRSILKGKRQLAINSKLHSSQKAFILCRELGFLELNIEDRPITSSWIKVENFDQLVNNFKASYFAGTLVMPQGKITENLNRLLKQQVWDDQILTSMLRQFQVTPEMLLHRMSQLLPKVFGLPNVFYFRFINGEAPPTVLLTKELNMTDATITYGIGYNEHHCRRLLPLKLLKQLLPSPVPLVTGVQKITFVKTGAQFLVLSMARSLSLSHSRGSAIALGIKIDNNSRSKISFMNDPEIESVEVSESCERCPLTDCSERVVEANLISMQNTLERRELDLQNFLNG